MAALTPIDNYYMGTAVSTAQPGTPRMVLECGKFTNLPAYTTGGYQLQFPNFSSLTHFHCPFLVGADSLGIVRLDTAGVAGNVVTLKFMLAQVTITSPVPPGGLIVKTAVAELANGYVLPAGLELHYFAMGVNVQ